VIVDRAAYDLRYTGKLSTGFGYNHKHDPIQRIEFMNAPKFCLLKRDHWAWHRSSV